MPASTSAGEVEVGESTQSHRHLSKRSVPDHENSRSGLSRKETKMNRVAATAFLSVVVLVAGRYARCADVAVWSGTASNEWSDSKGWDGGIKPSNGWDAHIVADVNFTAQSSSIT